MPGILHWSFKFGLSPLREFLCNKESKYLTFFPFFSMKTDCEEVLSFQGLRLKKMHWTLWDLWSNCETVKPNLPKWNGGHKINSDKWGFWISKGLFSAFNTHPGTQPHYRSGVLCWVCVRVKVSLTQQIKPKISYSLIAYFVFPYTCYTSLKNN